MMPKLVERVEKNRRRLSGLGHLVKIVKGVKYVNGEKV
jgi:hypothetical protein